jgi:hypothetical protein
MIKKRIITLLLVHISVVSMAWGPTGHRAVGLVAEKYLNKKASKVLRRVLNGQSIAMAGTWMDEIRADSTYDYTADWHWVTVPPGKTYDQSEKNPNGDIIQTIERLTAALKSRQLTGLQETEALKMLIHLVGDIHQPLHVGTGDDRGGNDIQVKWFRDDSNLHRVWDSDMIDHTRLSYSELAQSLETPDETRIKSWQAATVRDWANESMSYRNAVYNYGDGRLGYTYTYHNFEIVRSRLLQAGIRLASVLNEIYG